ncbi:MAG TPA: DUF3000 domain-containing protein [Streptosporangiaceae bacterium]|jgi:hypothetical protein
MRLAGQEGQGDAIFDAAVADLYAGRDAQQALRPQVTFEDVPAPKKLAPRAAAIAATVTTSIMGPDGEEDDEDVAWGRLVLLYDPAGQQGWEGQFRVIAYVRADVEPEMAVDPLLGQVSWSWLTEALEAGTAGYAAPSGTVTRVVTEGFGGKQDEPVTTGLEMRASWSPVCLAGVAAPALAGHLTAWCDTLCTAAGLPPVAAGVSVMPRRRQRP